MHIAISGSHGVGKSTLISELRTLLPNVVCVGNVMRGVAAAGHGVAVNTTPATISAYLAAQLKQEAACGSEVDVISDRILVDGLAYVIAALHLGLASHPWTDNELKLLDAAARLHASKFDCVVYVPIEFELKPDGPFHAYGLAYQQAVDTELQQILGDGWPTPVLNARGSIAERVKTVKQLFK